MASLTARSRYPGLPFLRGQRSCLGKLNCSRLRGSLSLSCSQNPCNFSLLMGNKKRSTRIMSYQFPSMTLSHFCTSCCCVFSSTFACLHQNSSMKRNSVSCPASCPAQTTRSFGVFDSCFWFMSSTVFTALVLQQLSSKDRNVFG